MILFIEKETGEIFEMLINATEDHPHTGENAIAVGGIRMMGNFTNETLSADFNERFEFFRLD